MLNVNRSNEPESLKKPKQNPEMTQQKEWERQVAKSNKADNFVAVANYDSARQQERARLFTLGTYIETEQNLATNIDTEHNPSNFKLERPLIQVGSATEQGFEEGGESMLKILGNLNDDLSKPSDSQEESKDLEKSLAQAQSNIIQSI